MMLSLDYNSRLCFLYACSSLYASIFHVISAREWYQGYKSLRHLLNPIHFSAQGTAPSTKAMFSHHNATSQQHSPQQPQQLQLQQPQQQYLANSRPAVTTTVSATSIFPARDAARVLILGCGNSSFGEDMRYDGWTGKMVNLDFSSVVRTLIRLVDGSMPPIFSRDSHIDAYVFTKRLCLFSPLQGD
jgi:hypothetical protein